MQQTIYSTVHPEYRFLTVRSESGVVLVDTANLKSVLKKDQLPGRLENHEPIDDLIFRLSSLQKTDLHPYILWLALYLPFGKMVKKDTAVPDRAYWNSFSGEFRSLKKTTEKRYGRYKKLTKDEELLQDFVSLDIETTGLNKQLDSIIQLSAVRYVNGEGVDQFDRFVRPSNGEAIQPFTTSLTGITQEDVDGGDSIETVLKDFLEFYKGEQLVGHNLAFDLDFLITEGEKVGIQFPSVEYADTLSLTKDIFPDLGRGAYKLEQLKTRFLPESVSELSSHNSLNDCLIAGSLYLKLLDTLGVR